MTPKRTPSAKRLTQLLSDTSEAYEAQWAKNQQLRKTIRQLRATIKLLSKKPSGEAQESKAQQEILAEQHREMLQTRCQELWVLLGEARDSLAKYEPTTEVVPERNGAQEGH